MNNNAYLIPIIAVSQYTNAIRNLINFSEMDGAESCVCAQVLLSAYSGKKYQLSITGLCLLDDALYSDVMSVIRGRKELDIEPHILIADGDLVFKELQKKWSGLHIDTRHSGRGN